jgi:L-amino acid N-acyltransferase YncA
MYDFLEVLTSEGKWKVLSRVFPENLPSLLLLRKHGFQEVGHIVIMLLSMVYGEM